MAAISAAVLSSLKLNSIYLHELLCWDQLAYSWKCSWSYTVYTYQTGFPFETKHIYIYLPAKEVQSAIEYFIRQKTLLPKKPLELMYNISLNTFRE